MTSDALLALVVMRLDDKVLVENEFAIEGLDAVHIVQVEGIIGGVDAGRLNECSSAQRLAVGEIAL